MIYPKFLNNNDCIGIIAPSAGITDELKIKRLDNAILNINRLGFNVKEGKNVRCNINGRSSSIENRVIEIEDMFIDKDIKYISCVTGGDFLKEILPHLNYDVIQNNPKWIQGYSDPTGLLYVITTKLDIATIYSNNFSSYGMDKLHKSVENNIKILRGENIIQKSYNEFENGFGTYITGLEEYNLNTKSKIVTLNNEEQINLKGRIIGGCTDVLLDIVNTEVDYTKDFLNRYSNEKIIWYFDNFDIDETNIYETLNVFKEAGWFKNISAIIFGRNTKDIDYVTENFKNDVKKFLNELKRDLKKDLKKECITNNDIKVILDVDIGHKPPQFTIINGCIVEINCVNNNMELKTIYN